MMKKVLVVLTSVVILLLVACTTELNYEANSYFSESSNYNVNEMANDYTNNDSIENEVMDAHYDNNFNNDNHIEHPIEETLSEDQINLQNAEPIVIENHPVIGTWQLIEHVYYDNDTELFDALADAIEHFGIEAATQPFTLHADGRVTYSLGGEDRWGFRVDLPGIIVLRSGLGGYYALENNNNTLIVSDEFPDGTAVRRTFIRIN